MGTPPDGLSLDRHRDLVGRAWGVRARRAVLAVFAVVAAAALLDAFGQGPTTATAGGADGSLAVAMPGSLRGGLIFKTRLVVTARHALRHPVVVLSHGYVDGFSVNSIDPQPAAESGGDDGSLRLELDPLPAGRSTTLSISFQVNPTTWGRRGQDATLLDGDRVVARLHRTLTVWP